MKKKAINNNKQVDGAQVTFLLLVDENPTDIQDMAEARQIAVLPVFHTIKTHTGAVRSLRDDGSTPGPPCK